MGLDVYLYRYKGKFPFKSFEEAKQSYDEIHEKIKKAKKVLEPEWEKYQSMTDSEKDALQEKSNKITQGVIKGTPWGDSINKWGDVEFTAEEEVGEEDSTTKPDHMFKIGYFRSSYNSGGINSVLRDNGIMDLYGIFDVTGEDYHTKPDWKKSLARVKKVIKAFQPIADEGLACMVITPSNMVDNEKKALDVFRAEVARHKVTKGFDSYSCQNGTFYLGETAIQAKGFISGKDCLGRPCTYVIYKVDKEDGLSWYIDALKIVQETIEWVLSQPDPESYYFHWSG